MNDKTFNTLLLLGGALALMLMLSKKTTAPPTGGTLPNQNANPDSGGFDFGLTSPTSQSGW